MCGIAGRFVVGPSLRIYAANLVDSLITFVLFSTQYRVYDFVFITFSFLLAFDSSLQLLIFHYVS